MRNIMYKIVNGSCAASARALFVMLAIWLGLMARPAEAAPFAYVANHDSKNVSVIDTATNKVVATIPVGHFPNGVAVTPDGKYVYVTNDNPDDSVPVIVVVIDTATNRVAARIPLSPNPVFPTGLAVSPDGKFTYVASDFLDLSAGILSQIDTATNKVAGGGIEMDDSFFNGVAVAPDGTVHVTLDEFELGPIFFGFVDGVEVPGDPAAVAVTPDGKHLYVGSRCIFLCGDPTVWVIDPAASTVVATIPMGDYPNAIAITPDGTRAYVPTGGAV
jgi:YVTN family beta-propeller protein